MKAQAAPTMDGFWQDTYCYLNGEQVEQPWARNQVQFDWSTLVAELLRSTRIGTSALVGGASFIAVGEGDEAWDLSTPTKSRSQVTLESELWRGPINGVTEVFFCDPDTFVVSGTPTRALRFELTIPLEVVGDLREFALFGGSATATTDSGRMLNWVSHTLVEKNVTFTIQRTIVLRMQLAG